jgi:hypothetical protein
VRPTEHEVVAHLLSCYEAAYQVLGERSRELTNDAFLIRTYEMSRTFGELALEARAHLGEVDVEPLSALGAVLGHAVDSDDSGAMVLYAVAMVVGPRLLVSLRDARDEFNGDDGVGPLLGHGAERIVHEIMAIKDVASGASPIEDGAWQAAARDLTATLDDAGYVDSFGLSR